MNVTAALCLLDVQTLHCGLICWCGDVSVLHSQLVVLPSSGQNNQLKLKFKRVQQVSAIRCLLAWTLLLGSHFDLDLPVLLDVCEEKKKRNLLQTVSLGDRQTANLLRK